MKEKSVSGKLLDSERLPKHLKDKVFARDDDRCIKCHSQKWLEVHHILPIYAGGTNDINNLVTLCSLRHHFAPDSPLKFVKYVADPNRPPFDLALDIAQKSFVSALLLDREDYEIAKEDPISFWKARYEKDIRNALAWMYENE